MNENKNKKALKLIDFKDIADEEGSVKVIISPKEEELTEDKILNETVCSETCVEDNNSSLDSEQCKVEDNIEISEDEMDNLNDFRVFVRANNVKEDLRFINEDDISGHYNQNNYTSEILLSNESSLPYENTKDLLEPGDVDNNTGVKKTILSGFEYVYKGIKNIFKKIIRTIKGIFKRRETVTEENV